MKRLYNWFFKPRIVERNGKYTVARYRGPFLVVCEDSSYYYAPERWRKKGCSCFKNCFYDLAFAKEMLKYIETDYSIRDYKEVIEKVEVCPPPVEDICDAKDNCDLEKEIC